MHFNGLVLSAGMPQHGVLSLRYPAAIIMGSLICWGGYLGPWDELPSALGPAGSGPWPSDTSGITIFGVIVRPLEPRSLGESERRC